MKNPKISIRIMGDPEYVDLVARSIPVDENRFYKEVSKPYKNRGNTDDVRVYVTIMTTGDLQLKENFKLKGYR